MSTLAANSANEHEKAKRKLQGFGALEWHVFSRPSETSTRKNGARRERLAELITMAQVSQDLPLGRKLPHAQSLKMESAMFSARYSKNYLDSQIYLDTIVVL